MALTFFISHSHRDERVAAALVRYLTQGVGVQAKEIRCTSQLLTGLGIGANIGDELRKDIRRCEYFVPLVTENSLASEFVGFEIGAAWALQKEHLIPLVFVPGGNPRLPTLLQPYLYRDLTKLDQLIQLAHELSTEIFYKADRPSAEEILDAAKGFLSHAV